MTRSLESLLAEFIERRERGEALTAAAFSKECRDAGVDPDHLERALEQVTRTEALFPEPEEPDRVGPWRLLAPLGGGTTGRVHEAVHVDRPNDPPRALKRLTPMAALDQRAVARLRREGALLAKLDHPGVARVRDVGESHHGPFVVMDLVEGRTLAELLEGARRSGAQPPLDLPGAESSGEERWAAVAKFGAQLAEALAAAHRAGLLHRDIKPSNVIVRSDGTPVLVDFGLAAAHESHSLTGTGDLLGTPAYMSPEQARGERADERADVWGVGAVLWELCTLAVPTRGESALEVLTQIRRRRPSRLRRRGVPARLARVVDRALAHRATRRTSSAEALAEDLSRCARGEAPLARKASAREKAEDFVREQPGAAAALALAAVAVAALTLALQLSGAPNDRDSNEARLDGTRAWLARDDAALRRAAEQLEEAAPREAALLLELAQGRVDPIARDPAPAGWSDLRSGAAALLGDDAHGALAPLQAAALAFRTWSLPIVLLGEAAREAGELERCEREWTAATRLGVDSPHLARRLGKVRRDRDDVEGAVRSFRRAVALDSNDWRNHAELARALVASSGELKDESDTETRLARLEEALVAADEALARNPDPPLVLWNVKAAILDQLGRRDAARDVYRRMIEIAPGHFGSRFNLAYSYDLDCRLDEAREAYREALEIRADSVEAHVALAKIATGSDHATCDRCRASVEAHPELVDPDDVATHLRAAIAGDGGRRGWLPDYAVELAVRAGREAETLEAMERELEERPDVDEGTVRLERAARRLRDALE